MSVKKAFVAFSASYFALVFLKDGTMVKLIQDASRGAQDLARGAKRLTNIT